MVYNDYLEHTCEIKGISMRGGVTGARSIAYMKCEVNRVTSHPRMGPLQQTMLETKLRTGISKTREIQI